MRQVAPDILLIDVDTPATAKAALRAAESLPSGTGAVALVDDPDPAWVSNALRAGVNAILSREISSDELDLAIQAAEAGLVLLHPTSAGNLLLQSLSRQNAIAPTPEALATTENLTKREQQILRLLSDGLGNKEIAARLSISDHTVKFHLSSIFGKLGASSRTEAVSQGIRRGLITI